MWPVEKLPPPYATVLLQVLQTKSIEGPARGWSQSDQSPRLVCSDRPEGRVLPCDDPSEPQAIPVVCVRRTGMSVKGPALRAVPVTPCLHKSCGGRPRSLREQGIRILELDSVKQTARLTQERAEYVQEQDGRPTKTVSEAAGAYGSCSGSHAAPYETASTLVPRWAWQCGPHRVQVTLACCQTFHPELFTLFTPFISPGRFAPGTGLLACRSLHKCLHHRLRGNKDIRVYHMTLSTAVSLSVLGLQCRGFGRAPNCTGSTVTIVYINQQGGLRSRYMLQLARHHHSCIHVSGLHNRAADELS